MGGDLAFFLTALAYCQLLTLGLRQSCCTLSGPGEGEEQAAWMGFQISTCGPQRDGGRKWNSLGENWPKMHPALREGPRDGSAHRQTHPNLAREPP